MGWDGSMMFRDCPWCGLKHGQMTVHVQSVQVNPPGRTQRHMTMMTCPECGGPVVVEHNAPNQGPPTVIGVVPTGDVTADVTHLPDDVAGYYADAIKVLRAGVPDAAAVQLRRTLEAAAAHYEIKERNLMTSITKLIDEGHVTKSFGDALHHIRQVGNMGAHHTDERLDEPAARRALRFTTALLRNLFEVPAELRALQEEAPAPTDTGE